MPDAIRTHAVRLVLLLCVFLASGSLAAPGASAGALDGLSAPLEEAVGPTLGEVTETVTAPVQEVTETPAPPVHEVTETVTPPIHEASEAVTPTVKEAAEAGGSGVKQVTETLTAPTRAPVEGAAAALHSVAGTTGSASGSIEKSPAGIGHEVTAAASHLLRGDVGTVAQVGSTGQSSTGGPREAAGASGGGPSDGVASRPPGGASTVSPKFGDGAGTSSRWRDLFDELSRDGSIRAPLPKWMAYVWPAIALTAPGLVHFLGPWESQSLRTAVGGHTPAAGSAGAFGVAGVHASSGRSGASESSHSLFSKIPAAVGDYTSHVPGEALAYLLLVAIAVSAIFVAIRWEISRHRERPGA
jgi:hypothetical protein